MANKKIVVLKLRELIYTGIFLFFGILLVLLLVAMFSGKKAHKDSASAHKDSASANKNDASTQTQDNTSSTGSTTNSNTGKNDSGQNVSSDSQTNSTAAVFRPGVYTTDFTLGGNTVTLQLLVDSDRVKAVNLLSLEDLADGSSGEEYIATMYPLMQPALEVIESSLTEGLDLSEITFSVENQYTGTLLLQAIKGLLEKAQLPAS